LQMGHPAMMKAIGASKKKNDKIDARKTADLVRCNLLPECYVAPAEMRELRRLLRYRNVVVAQAVRMKNKMSGLLMEVGAEYNKQQLHGKKYFTELLGNLEEVPESDRPPFSSTLPFVGVLPAATVPLWEALKTFRSSRRWLSGQVPGEFSCPPAAAKCRIR
jgi:Transposase